MVLLREVMNYKRIDEFYQSKKEHIINFGSFFANRLVSLAFFAFTTSVFINRAGSKEFGILTMLLLIYNYISVADLGMGYAVGYRLTRAVSRRNFKYAFKILQHALPFYMIVGGCASTLIFVFASDISIFFTKTAGYSFIYKVISFGILPLVIDTAVLMIMQSYNKIYLINLSRLIYDIIKAAPLLLVVVLKTDLLEKILTIVVAGSYIKLMMDLYLCYKLIGNLAWLKPVLVFKELRFNIKYGIPMLLTLIIGMIITSIDKFYITNLMSMEQLAYYSVALEVNVKAWFLIWAVTGSLTTVLIRRNVSNIGTHDIEKLSMASVVVIFVIYYMPLIVFAKEILSLWINRDFAEKSYRITRILAVASLFYMLYAVKHNVLQASGRFITITSIYGIGLTLLLISLWVLPKYLGVEGVAYSYVLTYAVFFGASVLIMNKIKKPYGST
jgi:O-antigen/teichoic acid export membrane protein